MATGFSVAVRNAMLAAVEATIGAGAKMKVFTGGTPANCAAPNSGTVLASLDLPNDWMGAPANGATAKLGTWSDGAADASGTAGHFRIYANDGVTCHWQGTVTGDGGGGNLEVDNVNFVAGQEFEVVTFGLIAGNTGS